MCLKSDRLIKVKDPKPEATGEQCTPLEPLELLQTRRSPGASASASNMALHRSLWNCFKHGAYLKQCTPLEPLELLQTRRSPGASGTASNTALHRSLVFERAGA
jgi:hypothetical protein